MPKPNYSNLPAYGRIPKAHQERAKAARAGHKACHGTWYAHSPECEQKEEEK